MKKLYNVTNVSGGQKRFRDKHSGSWVVLNAGETVLTTSPPEGNESFEVNDSKNVKVEKEEKDKNDLDKLSKIKGIGKETINDLKKVYSSMSDLRKALEEDSVPLRNDLVDLLKEKLEV